MQTRIWWVPVGWVPLLVAGMMLSGCTAAIDEGPRFITGAGVLGDYVVPVKTLQERKFQTVIRQKYDFSCGSAALATLLSFHYGEVRTEEEVFLGMWRDGDREAIRRVGFSLLDMKRYLAATGFRSDGFKVSLDQVVKTGIPGIALVDLAGYRHFVVVKGIDADTVLIGDPALGMRTMSRRDFAGVWNGIYFAINDRAATARANFNGERQWAAYPRAPVGSRFTGPLSLQELYLTAPLITRPSTGDIQ